MRTNPVAVGRWLVWRRLCPRALTGPERRNMVDLSGPINMDTFMHCMTNIRLGKDEYKELTPKKKEEVDPKKKEKKMPTQTVPEMQTELKELLEKLSSAADEREAPPRDSTIVTYPGGRTRVASDGYDAKAIVARLLYRSPNGHGIIITSTRW